MKIIKTIIIVSLIMISSCGYKVVNNIKNYKFKIVDAEFRGNSKINKKIDKNFSRFFNNDGATRFFKIKTDSKSNKKVTSRDGAGNDSSYSIEIVVAIDVYENGELINNTNLNKKVNYNKLNSQFELKQYEKVLIDDLVNLIITDINNYLTSIR